jgi:prepilin-type N-terminal cleavage/methylation domain-containing protein
MEMSEPSVVPRRNPADSGFTLIEIAVAVSLFAVGAIAAAGGIAMVMSSDSGANEQAHAVALVVQKIEELRGLPPAQVQSEAPQDLDQKGKGGKGKGRFKRKVDVVNDAEGKNTKAFTVSVEYSTGRAGTRTVSIYTLTYVQ